MPQKPSQDPTEHAVDFSVRYAAEIDLAVSQRMLDLGIPPERIVLTSHDHGIRHALSL